MNIIYLSSMYDEETYKKTFIKPIKPIPAAGKYHTLMCEGLAKNGVEVKTIAILPVNKQIYDGKSIGAFSREQNGLVYNYLTTSANSFIKRLNYYFGSKKAVMREKSPDFLLVDYLNLFAARGAIHAAKRKHIKIIGIVTDLPEFQFSSSAVRKMIYENLHMCDGYVFLSKQMNEKVNTGKKPYIVLEGHSDSRMSGRYHYPENDGKKIILYAGLLSQKYGLMDLCYGFDKVYKPDEELHIYGAGASQDKISELCEKNKNIKYFGAVPNTEVVEAELHASLLVNPRRGNEEFTKYSFPSKTMEYMATGTPVLMYSLPCLPEEYKNHVFLINETGEPVDDIGRSIREILDSEIDLSDFGNKAKSSVLENKNNVIQAKKLIGFLEMFPKGGNSGSKTN